MSYTSVFGGGVIYPSDVSYLSIALSADTPLEWPLESSGAEAPAARIIDVDPTATDFSITLPDATLTGAGQTILFNNLDVTHSFFIKDFAGGTLATVAAGTQWQVYLAATTTAAGTWRVFRYGASTATVQPSALDGFGLTVTGSTLSQSVPVLTYNTSPVAIPTSGRASAFVWIGAGAGTFTLPSAGVVGNNFFIIARNSGGGDLTITPSGMETIDGAASLALRPGDSATLITDGVTWYTVGLGQDAVFAFDYTVVAVTGGTVTLTGSQLNRIAYKFSGLLTSDCTVVVPATIQQYWINNGTTGAFNLFVRTSGGTPTQVNQNAKGIYYCDGTNMVLASDPTSLTTPIVVSDGGTGGTTQASARSGIGISPFADGLVTAASAPAARTVLAAAASGANSDITALSGLTTALSVAQGGTGAVTLTTAKLLKGNGTSAVSASIVHDTGANVGIGTASPAAKLDVAGNVLLSAATPTITFNTGGAYLSNAGVANTFAVYTSGVERLRVGAAGQWGLSGATYGTSGQVLTSQGSSAAPVWTTTGTVTSVSGAGSVNGLTLTGTVTSTGSLTLGGSVTSVANNATVNGIAIGYRSIPRSTTSGTATTSDVGQCIAVTAGITIPNSTFAAGDALSIYNNSAAAVTITAGVTTLRLAGTTTTGNRTLAARGIATVWFNSATEAIISGAGVT
jgi:hypothetical protein